MNTINKSCVAAVVYSDSGSADGPMLEFAQQLQSRGLVVRGLLAVPTTEGCAARSLIDLEDDTRYPIGQDLGAGSRACSLDADALLGAGIVLRRVLEDAADLVVVNRYGALEAEGGGFSGEMLELMSRGYPLLTAVSRVNLDAWRRFTGGTAAELEPNVEAMMEWFNALAEQGFTRILVGPPDIA